tara:strand:- start:217 stop:420 length:204 start_codon:yes stop_codon:yes gene_type:complete
MWRKMTENGTIQKSLYLTPELSEALKQLAKELRLSQSLLAENLLKDGIRLHRIRADSGLVIPTGDPI